MKRIFSVLLAAATLFAGCTKSDVDGTYVDGKVQLKLTSSIAPTRATDIAFEDGDLVGLYITKGEEALKTNEKMTAYASGAIEAASPIYYPEDGAAIDLFAYYPYAATAPAKWTIPAAQDEMNWTEYDLCSASAAGVKPSNRAVALLFNHLMAKVTVDLTVSGAGLTTEEKNAVKAELVAALSANVDIRTGEVSDVAAPASITLTEDNTALVVPQTIAQGTKIATLATENGDIDVVAGKDIVFEAGKNNIVKISLSIDNYISVKVTCTIADWNTGSSLELTKPTVEVVDNAIDLSANGTANCYVVNKGGAEYCFRADVKGNGAVTEKINPEKLAPAKARLLTTHVAALYFKGSKSAYGSDGTMSMLVLRNSVKIVQKRGVPYVYFETPEALSPGNAIIAVSDEDDNIIWSWHIWVTPDYELGQGDVTLTANDNCNGVVMMDRNLGALANGFEEGMNQIQVAYAAAGIVYQWGRKDPMFLTNVGAWGYGNYQFEDGVIVELLDSKKRQKRGSTTDDREEIDIVPTAENVPTVDAAIALSVANPASFIHCYNNDWNKSWLTDDTEANPISYLWGNTSGDKSAKAGVKTIYDPCPVGYKVPGPNAFSFFSFHGGDMGYIYHYANPERYNFDQTKTKVTVGEKSIEFDNNEYYGYYCYTNSVLKDGQTAADRTDNTTMYFPCIGLLQYWGNMAMQYGANDRYANITMMSNALVDGGPHYVAPYVTPTGNVYFSKAGYLFGWPASAIPVRCIKE